MESFVDLIFHYARQRQKAFSRKVLHIVVLSICAVVFLTSLAIALSKIILPITLIIIIIGTAYWFLVGRGKWEKSSLITYIRKMLEKLIALLKGKEDELNGLNENPAAFDLRQLLACANGDECKTLEQFVGNSFKNPEQFEEVLRKKATHEIGYWVKRIKGVESQYAMASYSEMLDITGEKLEVKRDSRNDCDYEQALVKTAFKKMVGSMQEKDRKLLEHEMNKYADKHLGDNHMGIALSSGGLVLANLGGFTTYTMSMSLLAGASATLGIGLPFAAYTSFASVLSVAIGPAGWAAIGLWSAHRMASPDKKVTPLVVLAVASIRARLIYEQENRKEELSKEISEYIRQKEQLSEILDQVERSSDLKSIYVAIEQAPTQAAIEVDVK